MPDLGHAGVLSDISVYLRPDVILSIDPGVGRDRGLCGLGGWSGHFAAVFPPLGWLHCCFSLTMGLLSMFAFQVPDQLLAA